MCFTLGTLGIISVSMNYHTSRHLDISHGTTFKGPALSVIALILTWTSFLLALVSKTITETKEPKDDFVTISKRYALKANEDRILLALFGKP